MQGVQLGAPGLAIGVYAHPSGGGKFLAAIQVNKTNAAPGRLAHIPSLVEQPVISHRRPSLRSRLVASDVA